ncbi:MAG: CHASE2 domain-containing protein [Oscillatoriaceae cyanobacterium Prado104]|jgi:CHASE2 domain-containing sensor protein|nr:CHASE2 domain-containing protein [Oscillatoriaceae cyanobacterium Prado104]
MQISLSTPKLVILNLDGSLTEGVRANLQIGLERERPVLELQASLPPRSQIQESYDRWRSSYRSLGDFRIRPIEISISGSRADQLSKCRHLAEELSRQINSWLNCESFRKLKETLLTKLNSQDKIRFLIQTEDIVLRRLPWYCWDIFQDYPNAEIALSASTYNEKPTVNKKLESRVKILAILGDSHKINLEQDRRILEGLPATEVTFLAEPSKSQIGSELWENNWDILFFAGHSSTDSDGRSGRFYINQTESLTVQELKHGFSLAVSSGLQLAIINSCDGLGIARQLEDLGIPQTIVMREPVSDRVAQDFLKYFLASFSSGKSFYVAVRFARQKLAELESEIPCADWLPVICQNPAVTPPTWQDLANKPQQKSLSWRRWKIGLLAIAIAAVSVTGARSLGWLQIWELQAFDLFMRLRPAEQIDSRLLLVEATETDVEKYGFPLPDWTIARAAEKLTENGAQTIALNLFRSRSFEPGNAALTARFQRDRNLIGLCSVKETGKPNKCGIKPPPALPKERLGFSDVVPDADGILRRHLLLMQPPDSSHCTTNYSLSVRAAFHYLAAKGIKPTPLPGDKMRLGKAVFAPIHRSTGAYHNLDDRGFQMMLNYRSPQNFIERVRLEELLANKVNSNSIKNRIAFVGVTAPIANSNYFFTPYSAGELPYQKMPGVLIQAQMSSQIISAALDGRALLQIVPRWLEMLWIVAWAAVGSAIAILSRCRLFAVLRAIASLGILGGICWLLLIWGWWVPAIPSVLAMLVAGLISCLVDYHNKNGL